MAGGVGGTAGERSEGGQSPLPQNEDVPAAFFTAIEQTPPGQTLYVLASYTALWALRRELVRLGHLSPFWQQAETEGSAAR